MTLTDREQFLVVLMHSKANKIMQKLPQNTRFAIQRFILAKKFPAITDEEWNEMAHDMDNVVQDMKKLFMESWLKGDAIKDDKVLLEFDQAIREDIDKIDLDDLSKDVDLGSELSPESDALRKTKNLKKEYDEKR